MAIPSDDAAAILKDAIEPAQRMNLAAQTAAPVNLDANLDVLPADAPAPSDNAPIKDPVQVAGVGKELLKTLLKKNEARILEAEKKLLPTLKDEPIQFIGDTKEKMLVRPMAQDEIDRIGSAFGGEYTKGINLPKIADDMELPSLSDYLGKLKDANADLFEKLRRGTLNMEALIDKANSKDVDSVIYDALKRRPGQTVNAEDVVAEILAAVSLTKETQGAWLKVQSITDPVAKEAAQRRAMQLMSMEGELYAKTSAAGSEAGRVLYALSQSEKLAGVDLAGRAEQLHTLFGAETAHDIEYLGQAYMALPNPASRAAFVKQGWIAKSMDVMSEVYINSLLSNPVTHIANILGNTSFMLDRIAESMVAGGIGNIRSALTGSTDRVYFREAIGELKGIKDGFWDAMVLGGRTLWMEEGADIASKLETRQRRAIGTTGNPADIYNEFREGNYAAGFVNMIGVSIRTPGRFLLAEDEVFKGIGYRMALHKEAEIRSIKAYDTAIDAGKSTDEALRIAGTARQELLDNPPESVVKTAKDAAKEMTFQKDLDGFMGDAAQAMSHPIAKLFVPFFKTPANIAGAILERSPIQFINPTFYKTIAAGGRDADIAMAKVATGSAIMGGFAMMATGVENDGNVIINGAGPSDPTARKAFERKGLLPYSVSIKQDDGSYLSITYNRFDPISGLLGMAADFAYYAQHEGNGKILDNLGIAATMSTANYMAEQPMLQGVQEIAAVLQTQDKHEMAVKLLKLFGHKAGDAVLSFAPGGGALPAAIARHNEIWQKNTMIPVKGVFGEDVTQLPEMMQGFYEALQKYKSQNPYFNPDLPPKLNEWGEKMQVADGTAWDFMSPVKIRNSKYNPVDDEMMRLGKGISPTEKKISGVELNADQYNRHIVLNNTLDEYGRLPGDKGYDETTTMLPMLMKFISSEEYKNLPTKNDQIEKLHAAVSQYRSAARKVLLEEDPYLAAKVAAKK